MAEVNKYDEKIQLINPNPLRSFTIVGTAVVTTVPSIAPRNIATINAMTIFLFVLSISNFTFFVIHSSTWFVNALIVL